MQIKYIYNKRAKICLKVIDSNTLEIIHGDVSNIEIESFIHKHQRWINNALKRRKIQEDARNTNLFLYKGDYYELKIILSDYNKVTIDNKTIIIEHNSKSDYIDVLNKYLNEESYKLFKERFDYYSDLIVQREVKLNIKKMKSRWGYCKWKDNLICLNSLLIKTPLYCLDYVIVHELIHFYHHNHQKDFHNMLESYIPNHRKIEKQLKDYGNKIII